MVTRETAASAAISASDSLRTQLEAAQKAREKVEGDLEKLKKEKADEGSVRVELGRLGLQLQALLRRINAALEAANLEVVSLGPSGLNTAADITFALENLPSRLEEIPGIVAGIVEAGSRDNALAIITELLTTIRSRVPSFPLEQVELGPDPDREEAARAEVRSIAESLSARLFAEPGPTPSDSDDGPNGDEDNVISRQPPLDRSFEETPRSPAGDA